MGSQKVRIIFWHNSCFYVCHYVDSREGWAHVGKKMRRLWQWNGCKGQSERGGGLDVEYERQGRAWKQIKQFCAIVILQVCIEPHFQHPFWWFECVIEFTQVFQGPWQYFPNFHMKYKIQVRVLKIPSS